MCFENLICTDVLEISVPTGISVITPYLGISVHFYLITVISPGSRILIGSISRENLQSMLDDHLAGLYKHQRQIKEREQQQHSFVATYRSDSEEVTLTPQEVRGKRGKLNAYKICGTETA